ncbi:hypothetical protein FQV39_03385 [Bosea sp. F3-2]|uniref:hypothetical protein n=1 Tax=Bosea sp. F3-2 TaxID=2599640 RepID=UPI0011EEFB6B|nr:hypothetical protein [Bosea sp. F3-2]QEL21725.1 hypothetical protein FQV39_03385 [Bosea sp. F3-2]
MKVFAAADHYEQLVRAMRDRRMQLGLSQTDVDQLAGLPGGYLAKCEAMLTNPNAKNARGMGRDSLPKIMGALGLRLAVIAESEFQAQKIKSQGLRVKLSGENAEITQRLPTNRILAERGRLGGKKRWEMMTPEQREAFLASGAAGRMARWKAKAQLPEPEPAAPARRERKKPPALTKRQAAALRKRLVAERAEASRRRDSGTEHAVQQ